MSTSIYLALPLMLLATIFQATVMARWPVLGIVVQFPLLIVFAWGILRSSNEGIIWAFVAGFFLDLFSRAPLGTTSLALMAAVLVVTQLQQLITADRFFVPMILTGLGMLIFSLASILLLRVSGYPISWQFVSQAPATALLHAFLVLPVYWVINALDTLLTVRRSRIRA